MSYAELQVTTHFSFLRGASSADELFQTAKALGISALGVVDRNSLAGIVRALEASRETKIRLVVGCRLDLQGGMSILVYPTDRAAYSRLTRLLTLSEGERRRGVIAMSAGNHAQAVAYHAMRLGIAPTIVMPVTTPHVKVSATAGYGARVVLEGETVAEAALAAERIGAEENLVFIHPYDDADVIAGQGTLALEMLEERPDLDVIAVPVGGGGLIAGMATAAKAIKPDILVVGVETRMYPSMWAAVPRGLRSAPRR